MVRRSLLLRALMVLALLCTGVMLAQNEPVANISGKHHPNLAAAQRLCQQAYEKIRAAQQANEYDMAGHAKKAEQLLDEANRELKEAAETANQHNKK